MSLRLRLRLGLGLAIGLALAAGCRKVTRSGRAAEEEAAQVAEAAAKKARELSAVELARYLPVDTDRVFALDLGSLRGKSMLEPLALPFMGGPPKPVAHRWDEACKFDPWRDVEIMMLGSGPGGPFTWVARGPALREHPLMDCVMRELAGSPKFLTPEKTPTGTIYLMSDHAYAFAFPAPHVAVGGPPDRVRHAMTVNPAKAPDAPNPALAALLAKIEGSRSVWLAMTVLRGDPLGLGDRGGQGLWGQGTVDDSLHLRLSTQLASVAEAREAAEALRGGFDDIDGVETAAAGAVLILDLTVSKAQTVGLMQDLGLSP